MMEGVESKKVTTKFGNIVKFCIRAGSMTARNDCVSHTSIYVPEGEPEGNSGTAELDAGGRKSRCDEEEKNHVNFIDFDKKK